MVVIKITSMLRIRTTSGLNTRRSVKGSLGVSDNGGRTLATRYGVGEFVRGGAN